MQRNSLTEQFQNVGDLPDTLNLSEDIGVQYSWNAFKMKLVGKNEEERKAIAAAEIQKVWRTYLVRCQNLGLFSKTIQPRQLKINSGLQAALGTRLSMTSDLAQVNRLFPELQEINFDEATDNVLDVHELETESDKAARIIQKAWRRFIDKLLFQYYKELIHFEGKGEPRILMKSINPIEASYLDAAAGVHIRFRLGGESFPPDIYYKIFTHRPIVDICANSPKDYTNPMAKQQVPRQLHNKWEIMEDDQSGWYKRVERNSWRRLSQRIILKSVFMESKETTVNFHHCSHHRKQQMQKKRKDKKIKWMQSMYRDDMLEARTTDPFIANLVQNATIGLMNMVDKEGHNTVLEWEVDELLEWTNALNFEEYLKTWKDIGRSNKSENFKGARIIPIKNDPDVLIRQANPNVIKSCQNTRKY